MYLFDNDFSKRNHNHSCLLIVGLEQKHSQFVRMNMG